MWTRREGRDAVSISRRLCGSKTLVYNDDKRLTSLTYGGVTDLYYYKYTGQRYRARLAGTYYRYLYNGDRVLEELNDSGTMQARYTTESSSFYQPLLHLWVASGGLSRYPLYDAQGTARRLADDSGAKTDYYTHSAFGYEYPPTGSTPNPYRFGGAWGYITDTPGSGLLQLGARFYWPEVGRFVSQDPIGHGRDWYVYADNNPVTGTDPSGLFWRHMPCWLCYVEGTIACGIVCGLTLGECPLAFIGCMIGCEALVVIVCNDALECRP
jgi:RHS repeat-associated protein